MDQQHQSSGLKPSSWKGRYGRLALAVLSVVCLFDSPLRAAHKAGLSDYFKPAPDNDIEREMAESIWSKLVAGPDLNYTKCYDYLDLNLTCARLELPMDHWKPSVKDKISLAVIRKAANISVDSPRYGGAIQVNPGGPGGSGIDFMLDYGKLISKTVDTQDSQTGKYFDIISFDPRGVRRSSPRMQCPRGEDIMIVTETSQREVEGEVDAIDNVMNSWYPSYSAYSKNCSQPLPNGQADIRKHITTCCVVRDMVSLMEAHARWREQEGYQTMAEHYEGDETTIASNFVRYDPSQEKLQYWGTSYGSFLGATFAALYPKKIDRMVLDGVLDAEDYTGGLEKHRLEGIDGALHQFFASCAHAGDEKCALVNKTGSSTAEGVKARMQKALATYESKYTACSGYQFTVADVCMLSQADAALQKKCRVKEKYSTCCKSLS